MAAVSEFQSLSSYIFNSYYPSQIYCFCNEFLGAFLIPFAIMMVLEGIPLFLIELGMGQRMRLGALGVWNTIHPWLGGIGISSCIVTLFVALYYNVIITWVFYYLFNSFRVSLSLSNQHYLNILTVTTLFIRVNFYFSILCHGRRVLLMPLLVAL